MGSLTASTLDSKYKNEDVAQTLGAVPGPNWGTPSDVGYSPSFATELMHTLHPLKAGSGLELVSWAGPHLGVRPCWPPVPRTVLSSFQRGSLQYLSSMQTDEPILSKISEGPSLSAEDLLPDQFPVLDAEHLKGPPGTLSSLFLCPSSRQALNPPLPWEWPGGRRPGGECRSPSRQLCDLRDVPRPS